MPQQIRLQIPRILRYAQDPVVTDTARELRSEKPIPDFRGGVGCTLVLRRGGDVSHGEPTGRGREVHHLTAGPDYADGSWWRVDSRGAEAGEEELGQKVWAETVCSDLEIVILGGEAAKGWERDTSVVEEDVEFGFMTEEG